MFKVTEVKRKIKEINLLIDLQINLSSVVMRTRLGTENVYLHLRKIFGR